MSAGSGPARFSGACFDVACAPNGWIWVTSDARVQVFDGENGRYVFDADPHVIAPSGLCFGPEGEAYIVDFSLHAIDICSSDNGAFVRRFGSNGSNDGQFNYPYYCTFARGSTGTEAKDGLLMVSDTGSNRVQMFTREGRFVRKFGSGGSGDGQFSGVMALKATETEVGVVDQHNHRVMVSLPGVCACCFSFLRHTICFCLC